MRTELKDEIGLIEDRGSFHPAASEQATPRNGTVSITQYGEVGCA